MKFIKNAIIVVICLALIPVAAVSTAAAKARFFYDGPNRVFSGGPLESGELHTGMDLRTM